MCLRLNVQTASVSSNILRGPQRVKLEISKTLDREHSHNKCSKSVSLRLALELANNTFVFRVHTFVRFLQTCSLIYNNGYSFLLWQIFKTWSFCFLFFEWHLRQGFSHFRFLRGLRGLIQTCLQKKDQQKRISTLSHHLGFYSHTTMLGEAC